jgi:iron complex outermembrane receptor protein
MEILKGPASVLYGRASPGGVLNIITKRPQDERRYVADLRFGSFAGGTGPSFGDANSYRLAADLTGPLASSHRVLYRLIGSYDNAHSFRDFVTGKEFFLAPSITWRASRRSTLTLEGEYRRVTNSMDDGLVAPLNDINFVAPINTRYQEPRDVEHDNGWGIGAYFTADLGGGWLVNSNWRSVLHDDDRVGFESRSTAVQAVSITLRRRDRDQVNARDL